MPGKALPRRSDVADPVGEGPAYEAIRAEARKLIPEFNPWGELAQGNWGCGLLSTVQPVDGGHRVSILYPVCSVWEKDRNSIATTADIGMLRATAITLLAYCEDYEARHGS